MSSKLRSIPRVWEVDWAIPADPDAERWAAYEWALATARNSTSIR